MIYLLPIVMLIVGAVIATTLRMGTIPGFVGQYMAIACLAGIDTICGGIRSGLENKFRTDVFVTGFFSNMIIAFFLAWLGNRIFIDLFLAVGLVLAARIFTNLSLIRRFALTKWSDALEKKRRQSAQAQVVPGQPTQGQSLQGQSISGSASSNTISTQPEPNS